MNRVSLTQKEKNYANLEVLTSSPDMALAQIVSEGGDIVAVECERDGIRIYYEEKLNEKYMFQSYARELYL